MDDVECLSDSIYAERPIALTWEGRRLEITEILARWRTPRERCFRVRTRDQAVFDLTLDETDGWHIHPIPGG